MPYLKNKQLALPPELQFNFQNTMIFPKKVNEVEEKCILPESKLHFN